MCEAANLVGLPEEVGLVKKMLTQNWLMMSDVENLLALTSFEVVRRGGEVLSPFPIPLIATFLNKICGQVLALSSTRAG
jgi:hypothetical protein